MRFSHVLISRYFDTHALHICRSARDEEGLVVKITYCSCDGRHCYLVYLRKLLPL